jgi:biopolymer transport protein ExbB
MNGLIRKPRDFTSQKPLRQKRGARNTGQASGTWTTLSGLCAKGVARVVLGRSRGQSNACRFGIVLAATGLGVGTPAWAQTPAAESIPTGPGFFQILFSGGPVGVVMMLVLIGLSLTAGYFIIEHIFSLRRKDLLPEGLGESVRQQLQAGNVVEAKQLCNQNPSFLSFVLLHGISELEFGWASVEKTLEDAIAEQAARMFRRAEYLTVLGNIAPMVGLLGTVTGMLMSFRQVAISAGTAGAPQLAEGIYQALVTTVVGLIIAIPSVGAFAIIRNRIDQLVAEVGYTAQHVFAPLRRKKPRGAGPAE